MFKGMHLYMYLIPFLLLAHSSYKGKAESTNLKRRFEISVKNEDYPEVNQTDFPWDFVVEPFRESVFTLKNSNQELVKSIRWSLSYTCEEGKKHVIQQNEEAPSLSHRFDRVGSLYDVYVIILTSKGEVEEINASVACKYVRRELRELTSEDRERFLNALEVFHRLDLEEGREKYGPKFVNYEYVTVKHLGRITLDGYNPYHGSQSFVTSHFAFILEIEQALQSIDHRIALPYWDYTVDSVAYGEEWQDRSPIFTDEWFGSYPSAIDSNHHFLNGRWAYLPIPTDFMAPERNAYGRLTDSINSDSSFYVGRAKSVCGLATRAKLPGCKELEGVVATPDLDQFHVKTEFGYHGMLHSAIGGAWDCTYSLSVMAEEHPNWLPILEAVALQANTLWRGAQLRGQLTVCPSNRCMPTDPKVDCVCGNPELDSKTDDELPFDAAYDALNKASVIESMASNPWLKDIINVEGYDPHNKEVSDIKLSFRELEELETADLIRFLVRFIAHPGSMSPFMTPLASTNDPIFGPTHSSWLRLWEKKALDSKFDLSWKSGNNSWYGHSLNDVLPFKNFLGEGEKFYTNKDLLEMMDPRNVRLPYVYSSLEWPHCVFE